MHTELTHRNNRKGDVMARQSWSEEQKERALLALHDGATLGEVHADTGIPKGTLASWKRRQSLEDVRRMRDELDTPAERAEAAALRRERTRKARDTWNEIRAADREQLAGRMLEEIHQLLDRINAPTVYKHVKVVSMGAEAGQQVEVVDVDLDLPNAADTKALVTSAAILVDKLQLLTGQATERHEQLGGELDLDAEYQRLVERAARGELLTQDQAGSDG